MEIFIKDVFVLVKQLLIDNWDSVKIFQDVNINLRVRYVPSCTPTRNAEICDN